MTLIASWGGAGSNSYIDLTQANSYIKSAIFDYSAWDALTSKQKQAALITATNDIDTRQYVGSRYYYDQHLEFPRQSSAEFPFNRTTNVGTITQDVVQARMLRNVHEACAHQALFVVRQGGFNEHTERTQQGIIGVSESLGPWRESIQYGKGSASSAGRIDQRALALLQPWTTGRKIWRK